MKRPKHCFIGADFHCGHRVGLTPPAWNFAPPDDTDHQHVKQYEQRKVLWQWFDAEVKKCGKFDWALLNGDLIEGKNDRAEGVELLATSRDDQVEMAIAAIKTINAKRYDFIFGTPYHVGMGEDWERRIADAFGGTIQTEGHFNINGLIVSAKHYIGNTVSPVSKFTAAARVSLIQSLWAELAQQPKANLIVRSHIHRCYSVCEPELSRAVWTTPALQGLGSRIVRKMDGLPVHFGFLEVWIGRPNDWGVKAHVAPLSLQPAQVIVI